MTAPPRPPTFKAEATPEELEIIASCPVPGYIYKYSNNSVPEGHVELVSLGLEVWSWKTVYGFWQRTPLTPAIFGVTLRKHLDDWICIGRTPQANAELVQTMQRLEKEKTA